MIRPRQLVATGRVRIDGIWVSRALLGHEGARRRALAIADSRARIVAAADGYLVKLAAPQVVTAEDCPGTPVVLVRGAWTAAPLRADELAGLGAPPDSFVHVRAGRAEVVLPAAQHTVDVATWIDVGDFQVIAVQPVADALQVVVTPRATFADASADPREVLGKVLGEVLGSKLPPPAAEQAEIVRALEALRRPAVGAAGPGVIGEGFGGGSGEGGGLFGALGRWLSGWLGEPPQRAVTSGAGGVGASARGAGSAIGSGSPMPPRAPSKPGWLRRWLERAIGASPLAQVIGRRQAAYVLQTLRMFEEGELDAALRRAIPFSSLPGAPKPPSLSVPSPRADLRLEAAHPGEAASSIHLGDSLYDRFRELYRKAARDLEAKGRIEEAAFVLFSLLGENDEGVAVLERHGRHALAAQMAEGRDLPAGLVIRLWFLAGDAPRAVAIARRTGAFADAIARLAPTHPDIALRLRVLWADRLAAGGDFGAAVDAVWDEPRARGLARRWLDLAIAFGGPKAMTMLARKMHRFSGDPSAVAEARAEIDAVLARDDDDALASRSALARAWIALGGQWPAAVAEAATPITRRLLADAFATGRTEEARELLRVVEDPLLRVDAEGVGVPVPQQPVAPAIARHLQGHERGLTCIADAVRLANGRWLLALGDAGMRVVDRRGRTLYRYEHPAERLVISDQGTHAIGVIERGKTRTLTRVDLVTGRAERWCDARFESYVDSFDGATWFVTTEDAVVAVDAQAPGFDALWRVGQLEDPVVAIARSRTHLAAALHGHTQGAIAMWRYELTGTGPVMRERRMLDLPRGVLDVQASVHPTGRIVARTRSQGLTTSGHHVGVGPTGPTVLSASTGPGRVIARDRDVLHVRVTDEGAAIHHLAPSDLVLDESTPILLLDGATFVHVRVQDDGVIVIDDRGRLVVLDTDLQPTEALLL